MNLPESITKSAVSHPAYIRRDVAAVRAALAELDVPVSETFQSFYEAYAGPFGSRHTGFELLDLVEGETILSATATCRTEFGFPKRYLVITDLLGNGVLVYDSDTDAVFNVDFEGSDRDLLAGKLQPEWPSFEAFLVNYSA